MINLKLLIAIDSFDLSKCAAFIQARVTKYLVTVFGESQLHKILKNPKVIAGLKQKKRTKKALQIDVIF
jgi:hypothetical protein